MPSSVAYAVTTCASGSSIRQCLTDAITSCSVASNPLDACFREGLSLFWGGGAGFWAPGFLSLLISFFIIAIAYMLAEFLRSPELNAWVKHELYEVAVSAVIFGAVIASLATMNNVVSPLVGSGQTHIQVGEDYLSETIGDLKSTYAKLLVFDASIGTLGSLGTSSHIPFFGVGGSALWGAGVSPLAGLSQVTNAVVTIADFIAIVLINLWAQMALLDFAKNNGITLLLPFSLLLRTFPITRKLGSTLIAFTIALYIVYPLTLALDKGMYERVLLAMTLDDPAFQMQVFPSSSSALANYQAAGNTGFGSIDAFPKLFLACPTKTLYDDEEYPFIFSMLTPNANLRRDAIDYDEDGDSDEKIAGTFEMFVTKTKELDSSGNLVPVASLVERPAVANPYDSTWNGNCRGVYNNSEYAPKECKGEFDDVGEYNITVKASWDELDALSFPTPKRAQSDCTVKVMQPVGKWSFTSILSKASAWSTAIFSGGFALSMILPVGQLFKSVFGIGALASGGISPNYMVSGAYDFLTCDKELASNPLFQSTCCTVSPSAAPGSLVPDCANTISTLAGGVVPSWSLPVIMAKTTFVLVLTVVSIIITITFFRSISTALGGEASLAGLSKII